MATYNRTLPFAILLAALLCACSSAYGQAPATVDVRAITPPSGIVLIDGKMVQLDVMEMAARGQQIMVWLRELEKLGWGTVQRGDSPEKTVFKAKSMSLTFIKGQSIVMVNSLPVQLPVDTYLRDGKLMVPLSIVAKSLGYSFDLSMKPVASISTLPPPAPAKTNSLRGQVQYNGQGIAGIKLALVDPDYNTVKGFQAVTDANGDYIFDSVPNGKYMAYVWVGHNPDYFNRVSEEATLAGGKNVQVPAINLGKILHPIRPRIDEATTPVNGRVILEWTQCEGAAGYSIVITKFGLQDHVASTETAKPKAEVSAKAFVPGITYAVDVEARDADGRLLGGTVGVGGKTWTFTIKQIAKPTAKPALKRAQKTHSKPIVTIEPR